MAIFRTGDGSEIVVRAPKVCPNGHNLHGAATVGWMHCPCASQLRSGHYYWRCRVCNAVIYAPPHDEEWARVTQHKRT